MKVSEYIAEFLAAQDVRHVFELSGGMIGLLLDSIHRQNRIELVSMHHEQSAAYAADAMSRVTGVPGVALATSGPGAINLLSGIASCYFDSTAAVFITGQVNRSEMKLDRSVRQLGFQEADIAAMAQPITKKTWSVQSAEEVPGVLSEAFQTAMSGRRGPVLIDIPMDVQGMDIEPGHIGKVELPVHAAPDMVQMQSLISALQVAKRPLILTGGGINSAGAAELFRKLSALISVPTVSSLMAIDVLPFDHPNRVGMIGTYGNRWANMIVDRSDLLIVIGSRLDIRQTGSNVESFRGNRRVFHVDCDPAEVNNRITGCIHIFSQIEPFLKAFVEAVRNVPLAQYDLWRAEVQALRSQYPDTSEIPSIVGINPNQFMHELSKHSREAAAFVLDTGQNQMWAAQSLKIARGQRVITSGGLGAMGFCLPAAIGAALGLSQRPIVAIAGDGGFQLNIQELQTVSRNQLPLKMVILNNGCHGMVRQFQQTYFNERYQSTLWGYDAPSFADVAKSYRIDATTIYEASEVEAGLTRLWRVKNEPYLLEVMIDTFTNVYPKLAFGRSISEMEPLARPLPLSATTGGAGSNEPRGSDFGK